MSHDHLMLTEPEMMMLAVLWESFHQLSYEEEGMASGEKRKERRKADSLTAGPRQYPWGNRGCLGSRHLVLVCIGA